MSVASEMREAKLERMKLDLLFRGPYIIGPQDGIQTSCSSNTNWIVIKVEHGQSLWNSEWRWVQSNVRNDDGINLVDGQCLADVANTSGTDLIARYIQNG